MRLLLFKVYPCSCIEKSEILANISENLDFAIGKMVFWNFIGQYELTEMDRAICLFSSEQQWTNTSLQSPPRSTGLSVVENCNLPKKREDPPLRAMYGLFYRSE